MYEMLQLLGNLPSNAFAGLVDDEADKEVVGTSSSAPPMASSSSIRGNSSGMYNLRHESINGEKVQYVSIQA
jgi:hypothetical protein